MAKQTVEKNENVIVHPNHIPVEQLADDGLNMRLHVDDSEELQKKIEQLASNIEEVGQLQPIIVADPSAKWTNGKYVVVSGFRRRLALMMVNKKLKEKKKDPMLARIEVRFFAERDEAMGANAASDGPVEPVRNYDRAERANYFIKKYHTPNKAIARMFGIDPATVTKLVQAYTDLTKEVREAWGASPDADTEIPLSRLYKWAKLTPAEQKQALESYMNGDKPLQSGDGGEGDGEGDGEGEGDGGKRIDGKRPGKRAVLAEIEKISEKLTANPSKEVASNLEGMRKALRWSMGEIVRLF